MILYRPVGLKELELIAHFFGAACSGIEAPERDDPDFAAFESINREVFEAFPSPPYKPPLSDNWSPGSTTTSRLASGPISDYWRACRSSRAGGWARWTSSSAGCPDAVARSRTWNTARPRMPGTST